MATKEAPIKDILFGDLDVAAPDHIEDPTPVPAPAAQQPAQAAAASAPEPAAKPRRKRGPVPTLGPTTGITLHLPTELVDQLHAAALVCNCTLKALCQKCLENGIKKVVKTHGELKGTPKKATSPSQVNL